MNKKLYVLPFDHRGSFFKMFGLTESGLTDADIEMLKDYKHLVYEGLLKAIEDGVPKEVSAILVDEQFGEHIHKEAKDEGITRILTTEKSGADEFDFQYGDEFKEHIETLAPDYVKALVRYNPFGDKELNKRQVSRLKKLNDFCKERGYGFLIEPLAPATSEQLQKHGEDGYEKEVRWQVMQNSLREFHAGGVEPQVWKLEGLSDLTQMKTVVEEARAGGRDAGVVVLGRGESEAKVREWLTVAARIDGVIGFAVGRTVFKEELVDHHEKRQSREEAVQQIADNYRGFVELFENASRS